MGILQQSVDLEGGILSRLAFSDSCVMLFDNFETPYRDSVSKLLQQFDSIPHVAIRVFLTMRSECAPFVSGIAKTSML